VGKSFRVGLAEGTVRLESYSPQWMKLYAAEERLLRETLGPLAREIQHIGSTAVKGLPAKPIVDIAVQISRLAQLGRVTRAMVGAGYEYKGEHGLPGRHFFVKGNPVTHHVHVVARGSRHWIRWIAFRDHLRRDATARKAYAEHKRRLARKFARNRDGYTSGKNPIVEKILKKLGIP
jgi:GrpB-like predicted nucleotidyltransferase (UPF0157 family)